MLQTLLRIVGILVIAGAVLWGIEQFDINPTIKKLVRVLVIVVGTIWLVVTLLSLVGVHL